MLLVRNSICCCILMSLEKSKIRCVFETERVSNYFVTDINIENIECRRKNELPDKYIANPERRATSVAGGTVPEARK